VIYARPSLFGRLAVTAVAICAGLMMTPAPAATAAPAAVAAPGTVAAAGEPVPAAAMTSPAAGEAAASEASLSDATAGARKVTFVNHLSQTIWVAASPDKAHPLRATGWVLRAGRSVTISVPNHWNGRFWGRTGCVFHHGRGSCQTGGCGRRLQCTGWGAVPATLAEYDLDAWDGLDFYDVSMVDGSNLPMYINVAKGTAPKRVSNRGCVKAGCTTLVACPKALQVTAGGSVVACQSACLHFGTDQYCCRGQWSSRAACDPTKWPVDYAAVFKTAEPYAYSYVDDDATSVFTCSGVCDYRITFGITKS
jgi:hypothetical protein